MAVSKANCSELVSTSDLRCEHIEFTYKQIKPSFVKGQVYSFINEYGKEELGECIDYNEATGKVKLKSL